MAVSYKRLFHLMIDKGITNTQLQQMAGYSANITTRLKNNTYISMESIEKICFALGCGVDDILEFISDDSSESETQIGYNVREVDYAKR